MKQTEVLRKRLLTPKKNRIVEKDKDDFENPQFYENLAKILLNHEGVEARSLKKGDVCVYFDVWREPHRNSDKKVLETFVEVIIGKIENSEPLTFSEALCLNTYQDSLSYSTGSLTWSRGSTVSPFELIPVDNELFRRLRIMLKPKVWANDVSYDRRHLTFFVRNLENCLTEELPIGKDVSEERSASLRKEKDFERARFYEPLIDILVNQDKVGIEGIEKGDLYLYFDVWREPYKVGKERVYEKYVEVIVGKVESSEPLTFSEAFSLNTYQDSLSYSTGSLTWSRGSMTSYYKLVPVNHELLQRLRIMLKPKVWANDVSYDRRHLTFFVRNLENYFTGKYFGKNYRVVQKDVLVEGKKELNKIISLELEAPEIAAEAEPGQFVVMRLHERGERIPLTIAGIKKDQGLIRVIFQVVGKTTEELVTLKEGDFILDLLGPLGNPVEIKKYDKPVICIAGGVGVASIYAKTKALKEKGNYVISIIGAKNEDILILEDEIRKISDELYVTTDDGSCKFANDGSECLHRTRKDGSKIYGGFVNSVLEALLGKYDLMTRENNRIKDPNKKFLDYGPKNMVGKYSLNSIAEIIAVGPIPMMRSIVDLVAGNGKYNPETGYRKSLVKTLVSLNPIMVDGTGLCGCCRVRIYNPESKKYETKFACVDGPVFNGLLVDFESLLRRTTQYKPKEEKSIKYLEITGW